VIALLGSVALAAATATPPPTIIRERVSPVCSTLHQLVIPLAQMNLKDKPIMDAIRAARLQLSKYRGTRLGDGLFLYNSRIDMLYTNVLANLTAMDQYLIKSYRLYPHGSNAKVDALRQRVQNVVDLERTLVNANVAAYAASVDNDGITGIENSLDQMAGSRFDANGRPIPPEGASVPLAAVPNIPDVQPSMPASVAENDPKLASSSPPAFAMRSLKWTRFDELQALMHREGPALESQALVAAHDCDGV